MAPLGTPPPPGRGRLGKGSFTRALSALPLAALLYGCTNGATSGPPVADPCGARIFKERCAPCHPDGSNVINPKKTLHGDVLADHGITTSADIVKKMRHPGPGMARFDRATISDADARLVADYVRATFR